MYKKILCYYWNIILCCFLVYLLLKCMFQTGEGPCQTKIGSSQPYQSTPTTTESLSSNLDTGVPVQRSQHHKVTSPLTHRLLKNSTVPDDVLVERYNHPVDPTKSGKPFFIPQYWIQKHGLFPRGITFIKERDLRSDRIVFLTGVSSSHFPESRDAVSSIQTHFPQNIIFFYDWGLEPRQRKEAKLWCNVEVRDFNFTLFPVQEGLSSENRAKYQSSKVFILAEVLKTHTAIIWFDTSVRFNTGNLTEVFQKVKDNSDLIFLLSASFHSTYEVTHPKTFEYLPSDMVAMKTIEHAASGSFLIMRTEKVYRHVIWWWYLCSLVKECVLPTDQFMCMESQGRKGNLLSKVYRNCTRVDQSILNVLTANLYAYNTSKYIFDCRYKQILRIDRKPSHQYTLEECWSGA